MIDNLSFIERLIIAILQLICIGVLIHCVFGFWRIKKSLDVRINRLTTWVKWYESQKYNSKR